MIELEIEDRDVHMALSAGGEGLHDCAPDNVAFDWSLGDHDAVKAAMNEAAHIVTVPVEDNRVIVNSMEPRGCYAEPDGERLHVSVNGQGASLSPLK